MEDRMRKIFSLLTCVFLLTSISAASAATAKDWTFLVYINGNNSLDEFGQTNLIQMEKVGTTDTVNVVAEWASKSTGKTSRLLVQKSTNPDEVTSPILQTLDNPDMGDWNTLVDFIKWGVAAYPAQHYFISVWDHGNGWEPMTLNVGQTQPSQNFRPFGISLDENTGHQFSTPDLGAAMSQAAQIIGHKVDIYGSDACLMAMAEIAGEMSDSVNYLVGSQEVEPGPGWPYAEILTGWNQKPGMSSVEMANVVVQQYVRSYSGGSNGHEEVTFSAFDLSKMGALNTAVSALGKQISSLSSAQKTKVVKAISKTQNFTDADYGDLEDFLSNLQGTSMDSNVVGNLKTASSDFVIANQATSKYSKAHGVSIWLPSKTRQYTEYAKDYAPLKFNQNTGWGSALASLLNAK
jgi:hypothetical protein